MDEPQPCTEDQEEYTREQATKRGLVAKDLLAFLTDGACARPYERIIAHDHELGALRISEDWSCAEKGVAGARSKNNLS